MELVNRKKSVDRLRNTMPERISELQERFFIEADFNLKAQKRGSAVLVFPEGQRDQLRELQHSATDTLEAALAAVRGNAKDVVIITNAKEQWRETTARLLLPQLYAFIQKRKIKVISAWDEYEALLRSTKYREVVKKTVESLLLQLGADHRPRYKPVAFAKWLHDREGDRGREVSSASGALQVSCLCLNVLSVGDSLGDAEALRAVARDCHSWFSCGYVKTLKLKDRPSIEELTDQLKHLPTALPTIMREEFSLSPTVSLDVIQAVRQRREGVRIFEWKTNVTPPYFISSGTEQAPVLFPSIHPLPEKASSTDSVNTSAGGVIEGQASGTAGGDGSHKKTVKERGKKKKAGKNIDEHKTKLTKSGQNIGTDKTTKLSSPPDSEGTRQGCPTVSDSPSLRNASARFVGTSSSASASASSSASAGWVARGPAQMEDKDEELSGDVEVPEPRL
uniref:Uncharacterized protein n=1 Tax=Chromera velia CCMP2878 TaxID=1169474 RepID=A0A0G4FMK3_9ALVE|eukprot:Cvel_17758.t1-p1 / transcript=Cvel_17758.t1 / gene=Cvel_17758 / organism=Chromera_velia_CCMP2878 / gene_product=hypothetical protein / transcript_product=hypothetical protein / location=Cvel_scaffold1435:36214-38780(+) / protein_length=449 / sequence_SO=supercontig / SO=protein_coding / is_pseudo=false